MTSLCRESYVLIMDKKPVTKSVSSNLSNLFIGAPGQNLWGQSIVRFLPVDLDVTGSAPSLASFESVVSAAGALRSFRTSNSKASSSYCNSTSLISSAMEVGEAGRWCSVTGPAGRELAVAAPIGVRGKEIALGELPAAGNSWSS